MSAQFTVTVRKGASAPDTVDVVLRDSWGWVIRCVGVLQPDRSYAGTGTATDESGAAPNVIPDDAPAVAPKKLGTGQYWTDGGLVRDSRPDPHAGRTANGVVVAKDRVQE